MATTSTVQKNQAAAAAKAAAPQPKNPTPLTPRIPPTVGRVVWYFAHKEDRDLGHYAETFEGRPMAALISRVVLAEPHGVDLVSLTVSAPDGKTFGRQGIPLWQGEGHGPCPGTPYVTWMPYQKGQAAKTEALEKAAPQAAPSSN